MWTNCVGQTHSRNWMNWKARMNEILREYYSWFWCNRQRFEKHLGSHGGVTVDTLHPHFNPHSVIIDCSLTQGWGQYQPFSHSDYQKLSTLIAPVPMTALCYSFTNNMLVVSCPKISDPISPLMSSVQLSLLKSSSNFDNELQKYETILKHITIHKIICCSAIYTLVRIKKFWVSTLFLCFFFLNNCLLLFSKDILHRRKVSVTTVTVSVNCCKNVISFKSCSFELSIHQRITNKCFTVSTKI